MIAKYLSLVKFAHTIFAMPFAMAGFILGYAHNDYEVNWVLLLWVVLCMVFARNAAMGFNRWADRHIDAKNARTRVRDIPAGRISARGALIFVLVNSLLFIVSAGMINILTLALSPVALLVILGYSYTKRFTALCHLVLGLGLALAPVGAYIAVTEQFHISAILLGVIVLTWVSGFDIIYALQDEDFDKAEKLRSIPSMVGKRNALAISIFLHAATAACVVAFGLIIEAGWIYWTGAGIFGTMLIYQHLLVKPTDLSKVNLAFFTTNGIASVVFGAFIIASQLNGAL